MTVTGSKGGTIKTPMSETESEICVESSFAATYFSLVGSKNKHSRP